MLIQYGRKMTCAVSLHRPSAFRLAVIVEQSRLGILCWTVRGHNPARVVAQARRGRDETLVSRNLLAMPQGRGSAPAVIQAQPNQAHSRTRVPRYSFAGSPSSAACAISPAA